MKTPQTSLVIAIVIASLCNAMGNAVLSMGMKQVGKAEHTGLGLFWAAVSNGYVVGGTALLAIFFGLFAYALARAELSFVLPITALTYVFTAVLAKVMLHEDIAPMRWVGTLIIMAGVAVVIKNS